MNEKHSKRFLIIVLRIRFLPNSNPGLCTPNDGRYFEYYWMNILENLSSLLFCFHTFAGVYFIQIIDIFAPPPFQKWYFIPQVQWRFPPIPLLSTSYPLIFAFFLNKTSYFFPNKPTTHMKNEKYTPLYFWCQKSFASPRALDPGRFSGSRTSMERRTQN